MQYPCPKRAVTYLENNNNPKTHSETANDDCWSKITAVLSHPAMSVFTTPWTVARRAPLSMGFSRQEYWSGLPSPSPGDLTYPGIEPASLMPSALADGFFTTSAT